MTCQRCEKGSSYEWADRVTMLGGYVARLCPSCCNAWHLFLTAHPLSVERLAIIARGEDITTAAFGREEPTERLAPIRARLEVIASEMFELGRRFVAREVGQRENSLDTATRQA